MMNCISELLNNLGLVIHCKSKDEPISGKNSLVQSLFPAGSIWTSFDKSSRLTLFPVLVFYRPYLIQWFLHLAYYQEEMARVDHIGRYYHTYCINKRYSPEFC